MPPNQQRTIVEALAKALNTYSIDLLQKRKNRNNSPESARNSVKGPELYNISFASDLVHLLRHEKLPRSNIGNLRSLLISDRLRSLLLSEMIVRVLKDDVIDQIQAQNPPPDLEEHYKSISWKILHELLGDDEYFWKTYLKTRIQAKFGTALNPREMIPDYSLKEHLINFQTIRCFQRIFKFELSTDYQKSLILDPLSHEGDLIEDCKQVTLPRRLLNQNYIGKAEILRKTREYEDIHNFIGKPHDLFREKYPEKPGYTFDKLLNNFIPDNEPRQRLDYFFFV